MQDKKLIYTYCLTRKAIPRFSLSGIDKQKIYQLSWQDLTAIVSKVKYKDFKQKALIKNLKRPKWAEAKIRTHAAVVQKVMEKQTVLPLKFGTIFKNDTGVKKMLRASQAKFTALLNKFKDKQEWGVKIYADSQKLRQFLKKTDEDFNKIKRRAEQASSGQNYLLEKKAAEELEEKVAETINHCVNKIYSSLGLKSLQSRLSKNLPFNATGKNKDMILNSVFLVDKGHFNKFNQSLNKMLTQYKQFNLEAELSGPWPVYSFL